MSLSILPHLSALVNSEKLLTQAARRPHIKNRPRAGLPGAGQNTAGGQRIRSADYVIPYHGIIGKRVLSKNIISARVTKYITYICSINPPKYSELMHIATLYAFCSSFKKLFQNQLCPRRPDRKQKARLLKQTGFGGGGWIRTTVGIASRFTVCPLWPLGNTPVFASVSVELVDGLEPPTC